MVSRGEAVARHLPLRSIDLDKNWVDPCEQGPDRCREYVIVFSAKAPQRFLKLWRTRECNHGNDFICLPFDVIVVRDGIQLLASLDESRLVNWCEVCKRVDMGSSTTFWRDRRAMRPLHRQRAESVVISWHHKWGACGEVYIDDVLIHMDIETFLANVRKVSP